MQSVKDLLKELRQQQSESRQGIRLPNADWNETDPREMIDFPCSDTWLDYYHLRGLTPRHSQYYRGPRPDYKIYSLNKAPEGGRRIKRGRQV